MANFKPSKKTAQDFNDGIAYVDYNPATGQNGDVVQAETLNNIIESQLWVQKLAENPVDNSEANSEGEAEIVLAYKDDRTPYFKAKNLKGAPGAGIASVTFSGATYEDDTTTSYIQFNYKDNEIKPSVVKVVAKNGRAGNPALVYYGIVESNGNPYDEVTNLHMYPKYTWSIDVNNIKVGDAVIFTYVGNTYVSSIKNIVYYNNEISRFEAYSLYYAKQLNSDGGSGNYVTTDTEQEISGKKEFTYSSSGYPASWGSSVVELEGFKASTNIFGKSQGAFYTSSGIRYGTAEFPGDYTLNFPDMQDENTAETIATQEWVNKNNGNEQKYEHNITLRFDTNYIYFSIVTGFSDELDLNHVMITLRNMGFIGTTNAKCATGAYMLNDTYYPVFGVYASSAKFNVMYLNAKPAVASYDLDITVIISDIVVPI